MFIENLAIERLGFDIENAKMLHIFSEKSVNFY